MKQKYIISRQKETESLVIKEFAALGRIPVRDEITDLHGEEFSLLNEITFESPMIEAAVSKGKEFLIETFRSRNFYPIDACADRIAEAIIEISGDKNARPVEFLLDDLDLLQGDEEE